MDRARVETFHAGCLPVRWCWSEWTEKALKIFWMSGSTTEIAEFEKYVLTTATQFVTNLFMSSKKRQQITARTPKGILVYHGCFIQFAYAHLEPNAAASSTCAVTPSMVRAFAGGVILLMLLTRRSG